MKLKHIKHITPIILGGALAMTGSATFAAGCPQNINDLLTSRPFVLNIADNTLGQCSNVVASTASDFFDALSSTNLRGYFQGYNSTTDAVAVDAAFNSLLMKISFAQSSPTLTFSAPGLGIHETFAGATRDISRDQFEDYLKKNNIMGRIMNYQAKNSPFSPITGQGGLIPTTMSNDFSSSFTDVATNVAAPAADAKAAISEGHTSGLIGVSAGYSSATIKDLKAKVFTLPLSYTFRNDIDPRRQLVLQLPITYVDLDGAKSVHGGLGVAYRHPMSDNWTLTPGGKFSVTGSADLATVAGLWSATLASTYIIPMADFDIAIGNMLGVYKTSKFSSGDYSFDPGITTTGMRNGLMLSQPVTLAGSKMSVEYSVIDARYFGDKPFADNSQEIGVTIGTNKSAFSARSFIRGGVSYTRARDSNAWNLNLGYWF